MESITGILVPGTVFAGRYQVIEELGRGGMGCVYRVFDKDLQEEVALKFINPEIAFRKPTLDRFRQELKTARKIVHKNVGRVFELEEREGVHFISMEYVQGENLKSLLLRAGPLSLGKALRIAAQVCSGLAEAHSLGIVHRDLKAQNIMIDRQGNARIMDFGIALSSEASRGTAEAVVVGTPESMSPEQAVGGPIDNRSDIYSLGIVLYQMVTGELPFTGDTAMAVLTKQKIEQPPDPRVINPQVPAGLSLLILKCLEKDPARRFQDVRDIIPELDRIAQEYGLTGSSGGELSSGRRSGTVTRKPRRLRRVISIPAVTVIRAAVLVAAVIAGYLLFLRPHPAPQEPGWKTSIAVLPVRTPPEMEGLRESLTEDVISELSRALADVRIIPSHSMWFYKDTQEPLKQIGEELKVDYVLELNLHAVKGSLSALAELSSVRDNAIHDSWKEEYAAISDIQARLPGSLSDRLRLALPFPRRKAIPQNAYMAYLNGWNAEKQYRNSANPQEFAAALGHYEAALKGDLEYAKAYVGIGNIYQIRFFSSPGKRDSGDFDKMKEAYEMAYAIDPQLAEANAGLAWTYFFREDLTNADRYYREAVKLAPENAEALFNFASFLRDIGLYDQAVPFFEKASEIDPVWAEYVYQLARCRMYKGDFEGAMKDAISGLAKQPKNEELRLLQAFLLITAGKPEEAAAGIADVSKTDPGNASVLHLRALLLAVQGKRTAALDLLKGRDQVLESSCFSLVYAVLGMKDKAVDNIGEVINHGFEKLGTYIYTYVYLKNCPFFRGLQDDPRFQFILSSAEREYQRNMRLYGSRKT